MPRRKQNRTERNSRSREKRVGVREVWWWASEWSADHRGYPRSQLLAWKIPDSYLFVWNQVCLCFFFSGRRKNTFCTTPRSRLSIYWSTFPSYFHLTYLKRGRDDCICQRHEHLREGRFLGNVTTALDGSKELELFSHARPFLFPYKLATKHSPLTLSLQWKAVTSLPPGKLLLTLWMKVAGHWTGYISPLVKTIHRLKCSGWGLSIQHLRPLGNCISLSLPHL